MVDGKARLVPTVSRRPGGLFGRLSPGSDSDHRSARPRLSTKRRPWNMSNDSRPSGAPSWPWRSMRMPRFKDPQLPHQPTARITSAERPRRRGADRPGEWPVQLRLVPPTARSAGRRPAAGCRLRTLRDARFPSPTAPRPSPGDRLPQTGRRPVLHAKACRDSHPFVGSADYGRSMEVPCCTGLVRIAEAALAISGSPSAGRGNLFDPRQTSRTDTPTVGGGIRGSRETNCARVLPVGRSGWAIAAGFFGLFAVLFLPAPIALVPGRPMNGPRLGGEKGEGSIRPVEPGVNAGPKSRCAAKGP